MNISYGSELRVGNAKLISVLTRWSLIGILLLAGCEIATDESIVFDMRIDMNSTQSQSQKFTIAYSGHYYVDVNLDLRNGPPGFKKEYKRLSMTGRAIIQDMDGNVLLRKRIEQSFSEGVIGVTLFDFNAYEIGGTGDKQFTVSLNLTREFRSNYSKMSISITRRPFLYWFFEY